MAQAVWNDSPRCCLEKIFFKCLWEKPGLLFVFLCLTDWLTVSVERPFGDAAYSSDVRIYNVVTTVFVPGQSRPSTDSPSDRHRHIYYSYHYIMCTEG